MVWQMKLLCVLFIPPSASQSVFLSLALCPVQRMQFFRTNVKEKEERNLQVRQGELEMCLEHIAVQLFHFTCGAI